MKNSISILLLLIATLLVKPGYAQQMRLVDAYMASSDAALVRYVEEWASAAKPVTEKELAVQPVAIREAYNLFELFYNPTELGALGGSKWYMDAYKDYKYYIVQNRLEIYQVDKIYFTDEDVRTFVINAIKRNDQNEERRLRAIEAVKNSDVNQSIYVENYGPNAPDVVDTTLREISIIQNFRPRMLNEKTRQLYLHSIRGREINEFLERPEIYVDADSVALKKANSERTKKREFLNQIVQTVPTFGGGWQLLTPPYARITFDKDFKFAKVDYVLVSEGGYAIYEHREGK